MLYSTRVAFRFRPVFDVGSGLHFINRTASDARPFTSTSIPAIRLQDVTRSWIRACPSLSEFGAAAAALSGMGGGGACITYDPTDLASWHRTPPGRSPLDTTPHRIASAPEQGASVLLPPRPSDRHQTPPNAHSCGLYRQADSPAHPATPPRGHRRSVSSFRRSCRSPC